MMGLDVLQAPDEISQTHSENMYVLFCQCTSIIEQLMASGDIVDVATACSSQGNFNVLGVVVDKLSLFRTIIEIFGFQTTLPGRCIKIRIFDGECDACRRASGPKELAGRLIQALPINQRHGFR
jgi:hypothetical protein